MDHHHSTLFITEGAQGGVNSSQVTMPMKEEGTQYFEQHDFHNMEDIVGVSRDSPSSFRGRISDIDEDMIGSAGYNSNCIDQADITNVSNASISSGEQLYTISKTDIIDEHEKNMLFMDHDVNHENIVVADSKGINGGKHVNGGKHNNGGKEDGDDDDDHADKQNRDNCENDEDDIDDNNSDDVMIVRGQNSIETPSKNLMDDILFSNENFDTEDSTIVEKKTKGAGGSKDLWHQNVSFITTRRTYTQEDNTVSKSRGPNDYQQRESDVYRLNTATNNPSFPTHPSSKSGNLIPHGDRIVDRDGHQRYADGFSSSGDFMSASNSMIRDEKSFCSSSFMDDLSSYDSNTLHDKVITLEMSLQQCKMQKESADQLCSKYRREILQHKQDLSAKDSSISELIAKIEKMTAESEKMKKEIEHYKKEIDSLVSKAAQEREDFEKKMEILMKQNHQHIERMTEEWSLKCMEHEQVLTDYKRKIREQITRYDDVDFKYKELQEEKKQLEDDFENEKREKNARFESTKKELENLKVELKVKDLEIQKAHEMNNESLRDALLQYVSEIREKKKDIENDLKSCKEALSQEREDREKMEHKLDQILSCEMKQIEDKLSAKEKLNKEMMQSIDELKRQNEGLKSSLEMSQQQCESLEKLVQDYEAKQSVQDIEMYQDMQVKNEELLGQCQQNDITIKNLEKELQSALQSLQQSVASRDAANKELEVLKSEIEKSKREEIQTPTNQKENHHESTKENMGDLHKVRQENLVLQKKLEAIQIFIDQAEIEVCLEETQEKPGEHPCGDCEENHMIIKQKEIIRDISEQSDIQEIFNQAQNILKRRKHLLERRREEDTERKQCLSSAEQKAKSLEEQNEQLKLQIQQLQQRDIKTDKGHLPSEEERKKEQEELESIIKDLEERIEQQEKEAEENIELWEKYNNLMQRVKKLEAENEQLRQAEARSRRRNKMIREATAITAPLAPTGSIQATLDNNDLKRKREQNSETSYPTTPSRLQKKSKIIPNEQLVVSTSGDGIKPPSEKKKITFSVDEERIAVNRFPQSSPAAATATPKLASKSLKLFGLDFDSPSAQDQENMFVGHQITSPTRVQTAVPRRRRIPLQSK